MNETQASVRADLRALPRGAWILFFGTFLNKFGTFVMPFLAIYMTRLGFASPQAGLAIGAYGAGTLGACLLGGYLADRFGRRRTIVLSMCSGALAMVTLSQVRSLPLITLFSGLTGLTAELYRPASTALLTDLVPAGQRVTAFAGYRISLNAGFALGAATGGLLARYSFLWLFLGNAITSLLYGLVAGLALPAGQHGARTAHRRWETWKVLRADHQFRRMLCASLAVGFVFVQVFSTMSLHITRNGFSPSIYGLVISLNGALIVLCELPMTVITRRYPARQMMALGYILIGAGFASNALTRTLPLLALTVALFTLGEMVAMPISGAYVADLAPAHHRGLYMGTYGLVWSVAFICGPTIGMLLYSVNPLALWGTCGLLGLVAAGLILVEPGPPSAVGEHMNQSAALWTE